MTNYTLIDSNKHRNAGFKKPKDYSFALNMSYVPVLNEEIGATITQMCLFFQKKDIKGKESYDLYALQSLLPGKNLFLLPDGRWIRGYKPAFYRNYPFALISDPESKQNKDLEGEGNTHLSLKLSILEEALVGEAQADDIRLFEENGKPSQYTAEIMKFLSTSLQNKHITLKLCAALKDKNLLVPWKIPFSVPDGSGGRKSLVLDNIYHIDQEVLSNLTGNDLELLNRTGALKLAYAQILSEINTKELAERQTAFMRLESKLEERVKLADTANLDELFGDKDDLLSF